MLILNFHLTRSVFFQKLSKLQDDFKSQSIEMEAKISSLTKEAEAAKTEAACQKSKLDLALHDLQTTNEQLKKSHSSLQKEHENIKGDMDTFKNQCQAAKEEAKKHIANAMEVYSSSSNF